MLQTLSVSAMLGSTRLHVYYLPVMMTVMIFLTGPEIRILASKGTYSKLQALVRPAQMCIFWEYMGVNSDFQDIFRILTRRPLSSL